MNDNPKPWRESTFEKMPDDLCVIVPPPMGEEGFKLRACDPNTGVEKFAPLSLAAANMLMEYGIPSDDGSK